MNEFARPNDKVACVRVKLNEYGRKVHSEKYPLANRNRRIA